VADQPILHGPLDIGAIIEYLVQTRLLNSNVYVACLELGNEVASGSGRTEVAKLRGYTWNSPTEARWREARAIRRCEARRSCLVFPRSRRHRPGATTLDSDKKPPRASPV